MSISLPEAGVCVLARRPFVLLKVTSVHLCTSLTFVLEVYAENAILCLISWFFGRNSVWKVGFAHAHIVYTQLMNCDFHSRLEGKAPCFQGEHLVLRLNEGKTSLCVWVGKHFSMTTAFKVLGFKKAFFP